MKPHHKSFWLIFVLEPYNVKKRQIGIEKVEISNSTEENINSGSTLSRGLMSRFMI